MLRASLIFASLIMFATATYAADWRYFGDSGGKPEASMFYDASSIQRPTPETVKVWVEGLPASNLYRYKPTKQIINDGARKIAAGYVPRFLLLPDASDYLRRQKVTLLEASATLVLWELLADNEAVQRVMEDYWEVDCRGERIGLLSLTTFKFNGNIDKTQDFSVPSYGYIAPDTTGQWLSELVCPKH